MGDEPTKKYILPEDEAGHPEARVDDVTIRRGSKEPTDLTDDQAKRVNEALKALGGGKGLDEVKDEDDAITKTVANLRNEQQVDARLQAEGIDAGDAKTVEEKRQALEKGLREKASG